MDTERIIDQLFGGPGRAQVLRVLAEADSPLSGREIARLARLSPAGAARALDRLGALQVTKRRTAGRATLHELNRESLVVREMLIPALGAERRIAASRAEKRSALVPPEVIECLVGEFDPLRIVLFGSRAREDSDEGSDFDLLVVLPRVEDKHATAVAMLIALGHLAVPVDVIPTDPAEIESRGDVPGSVLREALSEGRTVYERVA